LNFLLRVRAIFEGFPTLGSVLGENVVVPVRSFFALFGKQLSAYDVNSGHRLPKVEKFVP
jgi:hypothetical protein